MIPKFRMWHPQRKTMETVTTLEFHEDKGLDYICVSYDDFGYVPTDVVLMQSTGLKDKNGVDIFEGDIVKVYDEALKQVIFTRGAFCIDWPDYGTPLHVYGSNQLEVVGNIYENPELVEETNEQNF